MNSTKIQIKTAMTFSISEDDEMFKCFTKPNSRWAFRAAQLEMLSKENPQVRLTVNDIITVLGWSRSTFYRTVDPSSREAERKRAQSKRDKIGPLSDYQKAENAERYKQWRRENPEYVKKERKRKYEGHRMPEGFSFDQCREIGRDVEANGLNATSRNSGIDVNKVRQAAAYVDSIIPQKDGLTNRDRRKFLQVLKLAEKNGFAVSNLAADRGGPIPTSAATLRKIAKEEGVRLMDKAVLENLENRINGCLGLLPLDYPSEFYLYTVIDPFTQQILEKQFKPGISKDSLDRSSRDHAVYYGERIGMRLPHIERIYTVILETYFLRNYPAPSYRYLPVCSADGKAHGRSEIRLYSEKIEVIDDAKRLLGMISELKKNKFHWSEIALSTLEGRLSPNECDDLLFLSLNRIDSKFVSGISWSDLLDQASKILADLDYSEYRKRPRVSD